MRGHVTGRICTRSYRTHAGIFGNRNAFQRKPKDKVFSDLLSPLTSTEDCLDSKLQKCIDNFRQRGHFHANLDPLNQQQMTGRSCDVKNNILKKTIPENLLQKNAILDKSWNIGDSVKLFEKLYCESVTLEASHVENEVERNWLFENYEQIMLENLPNESRMKIAQLLLQCQAFDKFVGKKLPTVKRYAAEGAESLITFCDSLFSESSNHAISDIVLGIAHRGRLNLMSVLLNYPNEILFRKMKGLSELPESFAQFLDGDVLSHMFISHKLNNGTSVSLLPNPSHLEAINGVCLGKTRSKQLVYNSANYGQGTKDALCFLIHGDGAFSGQGCVAECFNMAYTPQFDVGGTIHLITNNHLGFTMYQGRSSRYVSDMGKMVNCPVMHVNVDSPEDVYKAAKFCLQYRKTFHKDIIVDLSCFRRWGHNEIDDASLTQPLMYKLIESRQTVPDKFYEKLQSEILDEDLHETLQANVSSFTQLLQHALDNCETYKPDLTTFKGAWKKCAIPGKTISSWKTGVNADVLRYVGAKSVIFPDNFNVQTKLNKTLSTRLKMMGSGRGLDWATGEILAFGSLMLQGYNVRISGQDVGRGTFSHRHVHVVDQVNDLLHVPLNEMAGDYENEKIGNLEIANSILSEMAVLGFEYGFSIDNPNCLTIWEAQFGDFFNGAQIIFDTFISSGETKWALQSGIVILLPHGLDGMGPEHSSSRVERFLQLSDSDENGIDSDRVNMLITNPTTPAQYFHLLRQQLIRPFRKPLIVFSPKKILRDQDATSTLEEFAPDNSFQSVLSDVTVSGANVKKVIIVSGKLFYALNAEKRRLNITDTAIVRLEQLTPFPVQSLRDGLALYPNCEDFVWCQEECRNSGAWSFVSPRFSNLVGVNVRYVGRDVKAVPASGIGSRHKAEEAELLREAFK